MKQSLQAFVKRPTTLVGIVSALMFQIIFSVIWMTAYDGVTDRTDQLRVAVVNEDAEAGEAIAANLAQTLPFDVVREPSLESARTMLNEREVQMVVHIPAEFVETAGNPESKAALQFLVNESNPALIKSVMTGAASQIAAEANRQVSAKGIEAVLTNLQMPEQQATALSVGLTERVTANIQSSNPVQGMNNQMVPMMMVLASYVGAMIMGMNFEQSSMAIKAQTGRWSRFAARALVTAAAAVLTSLVGSTLLAALGGQIEGGFIKMWLFQLLFLLVFMFVSQMFLYLFGMGGMLFNIMLLSVQLVSSGAMVPRELLSDFYAKLGALTPAAYAVDGNMNILFGGPGVGGDALALCLIGAIALVVSAAAVGLKGMTARQPQAVIASRNGRSE